MTDLTEDAEKESKKADDPTKKADNQSISSPKTDTEILDKTMTVTIDSKGRSVDDSALLKKENEGSKDDSSQKKKFYCHACMVDCRDFEGFARHMKGKKHLNRMESLGTATKQALEQQGVRSQDGDRRPRSDDRRRRDLSPRRGSSDRRSDRDRRRRRDRDNEESSNASFPGDLGDMVTVDEIGFEEQEQEDTSLESKEAQQQKKETTKQVKKGSLPEDADDYVIPDFDPNNPVGQSYVVQVSGYFCKLCHKFYTTESAAKTSHCQSKQHYDKFNSIMMNKLMAKALSKTEDEKKASTEIKQVDNKAEMEATTTEQKSEAAITEQKKEAITTEQKTEAQSLSDMNTEAAETKSPQNGEEAEGEQESSMNGTDIKNSEIEKVDDPVNNITTNEQGSIEEKMETDADNTAENDDKNADESPVKSATPEGETLPVTPTKSSKAVKRVANKARRGRK